MSADATQTRRLIVHMGVQKTGSTSLHHFLQVNRERLAPALTVLTPKRGTPTRDMGRAAALYSVHLDEVHETRLSEAITTVKDQIDTFPGTCLISHENLPGAMIGRAGTVTLYPHLEAILARLDTFLAPYVPEYVIYTREMGVWKRSAHNQAIRSDGYAGDYDTFLTETAEAGDWDGLANRFEAAAPGRAHVFRLEDEPDRSRPGTQLLKLAGLSDDDIDALKPQRKRRNESLNPGSLEFMRQINTLALAPKHRRSVADLVEKNQGLIVTASDAQDAQSPA